MSNESKLTWSERIALKLRPAELGALWKQVMRVKRREAVARNMKFWVDPVSNFGERIITEGDYEPEFSDYLLGLLKPGMVFFDIGANEGVFSVWASRQVGASGRIICIEPQQRLWPVILRNLQLNECVNFTLLPYAVGEEKAEFEMELFPSTNTGATSLVKGLRGRRSATQTVTVLPLIDLIKRQGLVGIDVIKMDIEGFELFALRGLGDLLNPRFIRNILVETHPAQLKSLGYSVNDLHLELKRAGYCLLKSGECEHWSA